jgi:sodium/bile acid cotransporter 7
VFSKLKLSNLLDPFLALVVGAVAIASILPCRGTAAEIFGWTTTAAITTLFFLHGAKLSRRAILGGLGHWRLHLLVLGATFIMFPVLGLAIRALGKGWLNDNMTAGILFLCLLPSTVQSSIAFTSIGRGNVPAAVCSAALSNVAGIFITPLLVGIFIEGLVEGHGVNLHSIESIALQLLLPFIAGHFSRPWTADFLARYKSIVSKVDRGSILLVIYTAFSSAVVEGLWKRLSFGEILVILLLNAALLAAALAITTFAARALGFSREDEVAIVFCGSKKSLASGVPMASVLFSPALVGPLIVPLMLFHQIQLMACAVMARRYAAAAEVEMKPEVEELALV